MENDFCQNFFLPHREFFERFRNKRMFITGGTGFFGKWLLAAFACTNSCFNSNIRVTVLSRSRERFLVDQPKYAEMPEIDFLHGDIRSFVFPEKYYDYLIHAATDTNAEAERDTPEELFSSITEGTGHVLDFAAKAGVKKILYVSTGAVYGPQPRDMSNVSEDFSEAPANIYGKGKRIAEQLCLACGIPVSIARCFAFVGPYLPLDGHFAIGNFINDCLHRRRLVIKGDGTPLRSYLYAGDLVLWLLRILESGSNGSIFNVGSDQAVSIRELAKTVVRVSGETLDVEVLQKPDNSVLPPLYIPSIRKAEEILGLKVFTPLESAIAESIRFYREIGENYSQ